MKSRKYIMTIVAMIICAAAQAQIVKDSAIVVYSDSTAYAEAVKSGKVVDGSNLNIDLDFMELSEKSGGRPWDAMIKDGKGRGKINTGWEIGVGANIMDDGAPGLTARIKNNFGWGHISAEVGVNENMKLDDQKFRSLSSSLRFGVVLFSFGNRQSVDTEGLSAYSAKKAHRNERYSRTWKVYLEGALGYQYCQDATQYATEDNSVVYKGKHKGSSVAYGGAVGIEKRFFGKPINVGARVSAMSFSYEQPTGTLQPVKITGEIYISFELGRFFKF